MARIVAGLFEDQPQADGAITRLREAGVHEAAITSFVVNPPGMHHGLPMGGDEDADPQARGGEEGAMRGAALGAAAGIVAGLAGRAARGTGRASPRGSAPGRSSARSPAPPTRWATRARRRPPRARAASWSPRTPTMPPKGCSSTR